MIKTIEGTVAIGLEEAKDGYGVCCDMLRAGLGQELWASMRMTYRAAAEVFERTIREMVPNEAERVIAEIQNEY